MVQTTSAPAPAASQAEAPAVPLGRPRRKRVVEAESAAEEPLMMVETKKEA